MISPLDIDKFPFPKLTINLSIIYRITIHMVIIKILISLFLYITGCIAFVCGGIMLLISGIISRKLMFKVIPIYCHLFMFSMGVRIKQKRGIPRWWSLCYYVKSWIIYRSFYSSTIFKR